MLPLIEGRHATGNRAFRIPADTAQNDNSSEGGGASSPGPDTHPPSDDDDDENDEGNPV